MLEMIVATGIFVVTATVSMSAILNVHNIQKKMSAFRAVSDNVNFAIEAMIRDIRGGVGHICGGGSCVDNQSYAEIKFSTTSNPSQQIKYRLDGQSLKRSVDDTESLFTSNDIKINNISFTTRGFGAFPSDLKQPMVIISLEGEAGDKLRSKINIQTTASVRN